MNLYIPGDKIVSTPHYFDCLHCMVNKQFLYYSIYVIEYIVYRSDNCTKANIVCIKCNRNYRNVNLIYIGIDYFERVPCMIEI